MFLTFKATEEWEIEQYQPSSARGTRSPPAMRHRLQAPKWLKGGPKWLQVFFYPSTPSLRKVCDGGEKRGRGNRGKKKIMTFLVATKVVASRPPERRADQLECRPFVPMCVCIMTVFSLSPPKQKEMCVCYKSTPVNSLNVRLQNKFFIICVF